MRDSVGQSVVVLLKSEWCRNSRLGKVDCVCVCVCAGEAELGHCLALASSHRLGEIILSFGVRAWLRPGREIMVLSLSSRVSQGVNLNLQGLKLSVLTLILTVQAQLFKSFTPLHPITTLYNRLHEQTIITAMANGYPSPLSRPTHLQEAKAKY